jgi:hypothetical protein
VLYTWGYILVASQSHMLVDALFFNYLAQHYDVFILRSLHDVHEMNAKRAGNVCLSVRMIQLENRWTDLDEICYGRYATGDYAKIVLFDFLQKVIPTWRMNKLVRWDRH